MKQSPPHVAVPTTKTLTILLVEWIHSSGVNKSPTPKRTHASMIAYYDDGNQHNIYHADISFSMARGDSAGKKRQTDAFDHTHKNNHTCHALDKNVANLPVSKNIDKHLPTHQGCSYTRRTKHGTRNHGRSVGAPHSVLSITTVLPIHLVLHLTP